MEMVVDASVLVAELLRQRGRARLAHAGLTLFMPEQTWDETRHELPHRVAALARRVPLDADEQRRLITDCLAAIVANVTIIAAPAYSPLEAEARWRLARDQGDWPLVALALALRAAIWTEDRDLFGCGLATWTTDTLGRHLAAIAATSDDPPPPA